MSQNTKLILIDTQVPYINFADEIFERDKRMNYKPIDMDKAKLISSEESRDFLKDIGINGEIVSTPSHSQDSISLILDSGECFVGDLEPLEYLDGYENNESLKNDWERIGSYSPKIIYYAHANQKTLK
jgi:glyoxylase-like metal-dependent hydrolase (beta-lactamase superfamily II)